QPITPAPVPVQEEKEEEQVIDDMLPRGGGMAQPEDVDDEIAAPEPEPMSDWLSEGGEESPEAEAMPDWLTDNGEDEEDVEPPTFGVPLPPMPAPAAPPPPAPIPAAPPAPSESESDPEKETVHFSGYYPKEIEPNDWQPLIGYIYRKKAV